MRVTVMGMPGAGKGTQAAMLAAVLGVPHLSTGDILRAAIREGTPVGLAVAPHIDRGELAPEALILDVVRERLSRADCADGFVLDGFPRALAEAEALDGMLAADGACLDLAIHLSVDPGVAAGRVSERPGGRPDDGPLAFRRRLAIYAASTQPVLARYASDGRLVRIDGMRCVDAVHADVLSALPVPGPGRTP